ncbi:MAG: hypothetical protein DRP65_11440 [Planctomycetota bacterium]|nr:MAG: hypothetical protein DRP65_11440 [Planctomycetota bacterium]
MKKTYRALILYNGIVILIPTLLFYDSGFFDTILPIAFPGFFCVSIGVFLGDKLKGKMYTGGIIGLFVWAISMFLFIRWMITHST